MPHEIEIPTLEGSTNIKMPAGMHCQAPHLTLVGESEPSVPGMMSGSELMLSALKPRWSVRNGSEPSMKRGLALD